MHAEPQTYQLRKVSAWFTVWTSGRYSTKLYTNEIIVISLRDTEYVDIIRANGTICSTSIYWLETYTNELY